MSGGVTSNIPHSCHRPFLLAIGDKVLLAIEFFTCEGGGEGGGEEARAEARAARSAAAVVARGACVRARVCVLYRVKDRTPCALPAMPPAASALPTKRPKGRATWMTNVAPLPAPGSRRWGVLSSPYRGNTLHQEGDHRLRELVALEHALAHAHDSPAWSRASTWGGGSQNNKQWDATRAMKAE
jgi:hypothetical protein